MKDFNPPKWANWLIERLCSPHLLEEIQGDLHEAFYWRLKEKGIFKARTHFIYETFRSIRISNLKSTNTMNQKLSMQKNYLKTGWRFLKKNKAYSILNIFGLALGISFCWLAYFYANDELSYDKHLTANDQLYRIVADFQRGEDIHYIGGSSHAMSVQFEETIPEIEGVAKIKYGYGLIRKNEENIGQSFLYADRSLIDYLDIKFLEGVPGKFDQPNDVVISETLAGTLNLRGKAVGKVISITQGEEFQDFNIRGVYKDIPQNTSVRSDMLVSYQNYVSNAIERRLTTWFDVNMNTIVKLKNSNQLRSVVEKMNQLHQQNDPDEEGRSVKLHLQPISEIHLTNNYGHYNGISRGGNSELIKLFIGIGVFCLIVSMINYSNFNISLYISRAKEVALRKVVGAERRGIFNQLITESFLSSFISGFLAFITMLLILPLFSDFVRKSYAISDFFSVEFIFGAIAILCGVALISGLYPAIVLSRFKIIQSLKGEQKVKTGKWITQSLLGLQFSIATIMVAGMVTMNQQVKYLTTFDTKIDYENVVYLDYIPAEESQILTFTEELSKIPDVDQVAAISGYNGTRIQSDNIQFDVRHLRTNQDLMQLLDINIVKGRSFDPNIATDRTQSILVNEVFVSKMGLEDPIGETVPFEYGDLKNPKIIGVVEDYHFESATNEVDPLVIYQSPQYPLQSVYIKLASDNFDQKKFAAIWANHFDPFPFDFNFLEDVYKDAYSNEQRIMKLVGIGCFVSVFLAAMGLIGILGLQLTQRLKEVSIRKILGASSINLYNVFSKKFLLIVSYSLIIGTLSSHYLITDWLNNYPYHVDFGIGIIGLTTIITSSIAIISTLIQVLRVIKANPVKFLRDE